MAEEFSFVESDLTTSPKGVDETLPSHPLVTNEASDCEVCPVIRSCNGYYKAAVTGFESRWVQRNP